MVGQSVCHSVGRSVDQLVGGSIHQIGCSGRKGIDDSDTCRCRFFLDEREGAEARRGEVRTMVVRTLCRWDGDVRGSCCIIWLIGRLVKLSSACLCVCGVCMCMNECFVCR